MLWNKWVVAGQTIGKGKCAPFCQAVIPENWFSLPSLPHGKEHTFLLPLSWVWRHEHFYLWGCCGLRLVVKWQARGGSGAGGRGWIVPHAFLPPSAADHHPLGSCFSPLLIHFLEWGASKKRVRAMLTHSSSSAAAMHYARGECEGCCCLLGTGLHQPCLHHTLSRFRMGFWRPYSTPSMLLPSMFWRSSQRDTAGGVKGRRGLIWVCLRKGG